MTGELEYSLPPAIRRISGAFLWAGRVSFWIQIFLGAIAGITLLFTSVNLFVDQTTRSTPGAGIGFFFSGCGLATLFVGTFWAFRYIQMARRLRSRDESRRPKPKEALRILKLGLYISLTGMLLTLLGAEALVGALVEKSFSQGIAVLPRGGGNINQIIEITPFDMFVVLATTNIQLAHFVGLVSSLWVLNSVNRT
ncbi:MAG: DUF3611 family protein [Cyanobacteria bacterium J06639_14]